MTNFNLHRMLRRTLLTMIMVNTIMATIALLMYPPLLSLPHSFSYILELGIMLLLYVFLILWATRPIVDYTILKVGTLFGLTGGLIEIIHISMEDYAGLDAHSESVSTGIFMIVLLLLFIITGYFATRYTKKVLSGMWAGLWCTVVCMMIVITFGLSQLFWSFQVLEKHNIGSPDFTRTGWTDMHAFVIADIFEACFKVLFLGPVLGIIFGLIGGFLASLFYLNEKNKSYT